MMEDLIEPVLPEQCLEHLWTEAVSMTGSLASMTPRSGMAASKVFCTKDLVGQTYLVFLIETQNVIKIVKFDSSNRGSYLIFGNMTTISNVKDIEPLESNSMFIVLESSTSSPVMSSSPSIFLYSGVTKVGSVYLPSLGISRTVSPHSSPERKSFLKSEAISPVTVMDASISPSDLILTHLSVSNVVSLDAGIQDRVTLKNKEGKCFRVSLPPITSSSVVSLCLKSIKGVLPKEISMHLMTRWYCIRNASVSSADLTDDLELMLLKRCLLSLIGYEVEDLANVSRVSTCTTSQTITGSSTPLLHKSNVMSPPSTPTFEVNKRPRIEVETQGTDEDWKWLGSKESTVTCSLIQDSNILTPTASCVLFPYLPHLSYALHLTYEEMKLHPMMWSFVPKLLDILFLFASDLKKVLYQDHYQRDFPRICSRMSPLSRITEEDTKLLSLPSLFTESPPSIYSCLQTLLKKNNHSSTLQVCPFPYIPSSCSRIRTCVLLFACLKHDSFSEKDFIHSIQVHNKMTDDEFFLNMTDSLGNKMKRVEERLVLAMDRM